LCNFDLSNDTFEVEDKSFNLKKSKSRLLITPLDWGLGHATRCIPIIQTFLKNGWEVIIAGDGLSLELLKKEFPNLTFFTLPGYDVRYYFKNMYFNILFQFPKILIAALKENFAVREIVRTHQIDLLISDNRFGCFSKQVKSIFITHQINLRVGFKPIEKMVNYLNHKIIRKFDECWIPDDPSIRLSGQLSNPGKLTNTRFIGLLSRMEKLNMAEQWDLVVVLSGPEPQRTFFEALVLEQIKDLELKTIIVQGKTGSKIQEAIDENIKLISYATSGELNEMMSAAKLILCRSGYSSLMDLASLGKKAILVPTPGQTEQEYLAEYLFEQNIFYYQDQQDLNLEEALPQAVLFKGFQSDFEQNNFHIL
jgi:uncharacterized protein (TIGR00661 family)